MFNTLVKDGDLYWNASFQRIVDELELDISGPRLREVWGAGDQAFRESRTRANIPFRSYNQAWASSFRRSFASLELSGSADAAVEIINGDMARRPAYEDTAAALSRLKGSVRLAVLSNADDRVLIPIAQDLGFPFEAILSSEAARAYKPRPAIFKNILGTLKVSPAEAVYVGDRQYEDVQGAFSVGITTAWINRAGLPRNPDLPAPDYELASLLELPDIVARSGQTVPTPPKETTL